MADASYCQTSFLGGEWSQAAQGRFDQPAYRIAMNVCLNGLPLEAGLWTRRPGLQFCATTRGGQPGRLIPFDFQENAPYTMEFTNAYLRLFAGKSLAMTNDQQAVASISTASPAKVATGTHGWSSGNSVMFNSLGSNNPLLHNRAFTITVTSSTEFTIADAITGAAIDGSTLGTFVSGNVTRINEMATPYIGTDWSALRSVQAETTAVLLHGSYQPQLLSVNQKPAATFATFYPLTALNLIDGPYLDPAPGGAQLTPSGTTGIINLTLAFPAYSTSTVYTVGSFVTSSSISYQSLIDANLNNTPASVPTAWKVVNQGIAVGPNGFLSTDIGRNMRLLSGGKWTWGRITGLLNLISGTLSGSANIGTLTGGGGLSAAFNAVAPQTQAQSASAIQFQNINLGQSNTLDVYVGKNYSGASDQRIAFATFFPSSDFGLFNTQVGTTNLFAWNFTLNLRGSATLPASPSAGTLLGTYVAPGGILGAFTSYTMLSDPITITSNDTTTAWKYVWFEAIAQLQNATNRVIGTTIWVTCAQAEFFSPQGSGSNGVSFEILGPDLPSTTATNVWRLGLYSNTTGWPTCGTYHEGRLWIAGSVGNRIDGSVPSSINTVTNSVSFAPTEHDGTVTDASGIDYTFDAPDVNTIFHMTPDQQGIIVGTQAGEWLVQASALNNPLTPTSMQAHRVTKIGCANIEPRRAEHTLLIVHKHQRKVVEYFADVFSGKFSAPDLSEKAKHLTVSGIAEIAYQQEISPTLWARLTNGSLIGMSYKRDSLVSSQGPTFAGWHRHTLGSSRTVESICVGPNADGTLDALSMVSNDISTGVRHVAMMNDLFEEGDALTDAWYLDDAVAPTAMVTNSTVSMTFYGLWHLNGKTVSVFAGGLDCGDFAVANGAVTVPFSGDFTAAYASSLTTLPVVIGFTYTSQGQLLRPITPADTGARTGPALGKKRRQHAYAALLVGTKGISFGTDFAKLNTANLTTDGGTPLTYLQLKSGTHRQTITDPYSYDSMICWQITRPFPANIAALGGFIETQD